MMTTKKRWAILSGMTAIVMAGMLLVFTEPNSEEHNCPDCKKPGGNKMRIGQKGAEFSPMPQVERMRLPSERMVLPMPDEELVELLKQLDPERLDKLMHLRKVNPEVYMRMLEETMSEAMKLKELEERDPKRYEQVIQERTMEKNIKELAQQYRKSQSDDDKEGLKNEIKTKLEKLFDLRESQREADIKRPEQELAKLKEKMKTRKANRDKIIERRQKDLIAEEDDLGW